MDLSHDFMSVIFFQNCVDLLRSDPCSCSETCLLPFDGVNHVTGIKVEEVADTEEEGDPQPVTFRTIRSESEVSFKCV
jgi:hypothetical protein